MATEEQARRARDLHQDKLAAMGAHGVSVEPLQKTTPTASSFGVVAWIEPKVAKRHGAFPPALEIQERGRTLKVPLVVRESEPFRPE